MSGTREIRNSGADPAFAERQAARIASAIKNVREIEKKAEVKVRDADRARQAERDAAIRAEQAAAEKRKS